MRIPRLLLLGFLFLHPVRAWAHGGTPIPAAYGVPTINGNRGATEWSAATPVPVFPTDFPGSLFYVMDDGGFLYLGLFVPDPDLNFNDGFWVRIDSRHDGVAVPGDDEVVIQSTNSFFDSHWTGEFWAVVDDHRDGIGAGGTITGGNFFEMAHLLKSGDPEDMSATQGETIGLCVFYQNNGTIFGNSDFPHGCIGDGDLQDSYVDYTITDNLVGVTPSPATQTQLAVRPNPVRRGGVLEIHCVLHEGVAAFGLYSAAGRKVADLGTAQAEPSETVLRWIVPVAQESKLQPGVYFVRAQGPGVHLHPAAVVIQ